MAATLEFRQCMHKRGWLFSSSLNRYCIWDTLGRRSMGGKAYRLILGFQYIVV